MLASLCEVPEWKSMRSSVNWSQQDWRSRIGIETVITRDLKRSSNPVLLPFRFRFLSANPADSSLRWISSTSIRAPHRDSRAYHLFIGPLKFVCASPDGGLIREAVTRILGMWPWNAVQKASFREADFTGLSPEGRRA